MSMPVMPIIAARAVVALGVELPRLAEEELVLSDLERGAVAERDGVAIRVASPRDVVRDVIAGVLVGVLLEALGLEEHDEEDDLAPAPDRDRLPRADHRAGHVLELEVSRLGQVAREARARVGGHKKIKLTR